MVNNNLFRCVRKIGVKPPYSMSAEELSVDDCPTLLTNELKVSGSYQHIMFNDYLWDVYKLENGLNCIKLIEPEIGLLTADEAKILLSASRGYGFEKAGFREETKLFVESQEKNMPECNDGDKVSDDGKRFNISDNSLLLDMEWHDENYVPFNDEEQRSIVSHSISEEFSKIKKTNSSESRKKIDYLSTGCKVTKKKDKPELKNSVPGVIGVDDREAVTDSLLLRTVWSDIARVERRTGSCTNIQVGSGFFINPTTVVTAAHNVRSHRNGNACDNRSWNVYGSSMQDGVNKKYRGKDQIPNPNDITQTLRFITNAWQNNPGLNVPTGNLSIFSNDYAVLKINPPHYGENYAVLNTFPVLPIVTTKDDFGLVAGHPTHVRGNFVHPTLYKETKEIFFGNIGVVNDDISNQYGLINHNMDTTGGNSGGPFFYTQGPGSYGAHGVISFQVPLNGIVRNFAAPIDNNSSGNILTWASMPSPNVNVLINSPSDLSIIDWSTITDNTFSASLESSVRNVDLRTVEDNLIWTSNSIGQFSSGLTVTSLEARSALRPGVHEISVLINDSNYLGIETVSIEVTGPSGDFTHKKNYCILDLAVSNVTCSLDLSWSTSNTKSALVWNETDDVLLLKANDISSYPFMTTIDEKTLVLYASAEKILDLDSIQVSAKLPRGNLTVPGTACSLQPSPVAPNGTMRDPKATPPGCGTELSWSNVQWATPSIFYRPVSGGSWQHLYEIPCDLEGTVCSGSIHTDDHAGAELISESGYEFKLVQFNDANSGDLTASFTVTAKRYADAYEFDDGWYQLPNDNSQNTASHALANGQSITTLTQLDEAQHNHNFHRPAAYDPAIDKDSFNISTNGMTNQTQLEVKLFNMASDLRVNFKVQCAGQRFIDNIGGDDGEDYTGLWDIPVSPIVVSSYDAATRTATMKFNVVNYETYTFHPSNSTNTRLSCQHNRVTVNRTAGQAGEDLSYSIVVNDANPVDPNTPTLDSVLAMGTKTYKVELLGDNFGVNSAANLKVSVREDVDGSDPLAVYPAAMFHRQGTHVSGHAHEGKNYIRFPILKTARQSIFLQKGLCFKVQSDTLDSNEVCYKIPTRTAIGGFAGGPVQSYNHTSLPQDIDDNAYVTNSNGNLLKLWGNSWKKVPMNYTVTPNTELNINFKSTHGVPEISGVGFILAGQDNLSGTRFWEFIGDQPDEWGIQDHHNYSGTDYKSYTIKVGEKFTGQISHMVFAADHDNQDVAQNVVFQTPTLTENTPIQNFMGKPVLRVQPGVQDVDENEYSVNSAGDTLTLTGNTWKAISNSHPITANTVLQFEFRSLGQEPEINGIGFTNSLDATPATNRGWQVHGTDPWPEGISTHNNYTGNGWKTYTIEVGETFTGTYDYMVFVGDDDTPVNQNVQYRNPQLYDVTPVQNFMGKPVLRVKPGNQDVDENEYSVNAAGDTLTLTGNTWKAISNTHPITANTVLQFDFRSLGQEPEINGIGFTNSLNSTPANNRGWQVHGTDPWPEGISTHNNYTGNGWKTYTIEVGETFTGTYDYMVFVGDDDTPVNQNVQYRNPQLYDVTPVQNTFVNKSILRIQPGIQDIDANAYSVNSSRDTLTLTGNTWKAINYQYNVTPSTVLTFEFRSLGQEPEINGIGFTNSLNSTPPNNGGWQVHGTQNWLEGITHDNYTGNGWRTYSIDIGQTFTGFINYMVFVCDDDVTPVTKNVQYRNPRLIN